MFMYMNSLFFPSLAVCYEQDKKASKDPPFFCLLFLHLSLVEKFPVSSPCCLTHGVGPGFTVHLLPLSIQVLGDLLPSPRVVLWA